MTVPCVREQRVRHCVFLMAEFSNPNRANGNSDMEYNSQSSRASTEEGNVNVYTMDLRDIMYLSCCAGTRSIDD